MRAIDNQPLAQRAVYVRLALHGKLNTKHQTLAPHLPDEIEFIREMRQFRAQLRTALANVLQQIFVLDDRQKLQRDGTSQRSAAEGRAMQAGRESFRKGRSEEHTSELQSPVHLV